MLTLLWNFLFLSLSALELCLLELLLCSLSIFWEPLCGYLCLDVTMSQRKATNSRRERYSEDVQLASVLFWERPTTVRPFKLWLSLSLLLSWTTLAFPHFHTVMHCMWCSLWEEHNSHPLLPVHPSSLSSGEIRAKTTPLKDNSL